MQFEPFSASKLFLVDQIELCSHYLPYNDFQITRLVKEHTRKTILAIGDGANDVGMIQEADIGVGISGMEGMQVG